MGRILTKIIFENEKTKKLGKSHRKIVYLFLKK